MQLIQGKIVGKAVTLAAELGVADAMGESPTPVEQLAAATGTQVDGLYRLLRLLASVGVFSESEGHAFALTPVGRALRSDAPRSIRSLARWYNERSLETAWLELEHAVRTGESAFERAHGLPCFEYFEKHPSAAKIFDEAMGNFTASAGEAVAKAYDFSDVKHLVDVGGSQGVLLSAVLDHFPNVRTTLFDLPHVVERAMPALAAGRHAGRIETASGDFFAGVPAGADAYIMKSIVHDWDDDRCVSLLSNCRKVMAPGGRVLVVEGLVSNGPESVYLKILDMQMLVATPGGRERTEAEFAALFQKAGLKLTRVFRTESPLCVIESRDAALA
jgi:hypothetical protein